MNSYEFFFNNQNKVPEYFKTGEYLYRNGTPAIGVYFICSGRVQVITQTEEGFLNMEIKSAGDIVALDEVELSYYVSDAIAMENTEVYFFDRYYLHELLKEWESK